MRDRLRAPRGTVSTQELKHTRRFKYHYQGKSFYLTLPRQYTSAEDNVRKIIELDLFYGTHDNTQQKYKQLLKGSKNLPVVTEGRSLAEILLEFLKQTGRSLDKNIYYHCYRMVVRWGPEATYEAIPQLLTRMNYKTSTFNGRKTVLNAFCSWCVKRGLIEANPVEDLPSRKRNGKNPTRKRLTTQQVIDLLEAVRTDRFSPRPCRYHHSHYYPILYFLASTGVRPAEAIGLQVKKVDFTRRTVLIDQALARTRKGTTSKNRVMKTTKMEDSREIPVKGKLLRILKAQCAGRKREDLVFPSPNGLSCDDRAIGENVMQPILAQLEIERRVLYCLRHSFISRCFEQGMDVKSVQALTGHRDVRVLLEIYAEVIKEKVHLPSLGGSR